MSIRASAAAPATAQDFEIIPRHKGGRHLKYPDHTPMTNLILSVLDKVGVPMDTLGDSTGALVGA